MGNILKELIYLKTNNFEKVVSNVTEFKDMIHLSSCREISFNVYSMSITKNKIDDIIKGYAKMKVAK